MSRDFVTTMPPRLRRRRLLALLAAGLSPLAPPARSQPAPAARLRWRLQGQAQRLEVGEVLMLDLEVWVSSWFQAPVDFPATLAADGALVEPVGGSPDSRFEELDGQRWTGLIRRYRLLPVQPGEISVRLTEALPVHPGGGTPLRLQPPAPLRLQVRVPAGAEDIQPFVAARRLELSQRWSPQPDKGEALQVGDLVQREIVLLTDSSSPLLPSADFGQPIGVAVYVQAVRVDEQRADAAGPALQTRRHLAVYTLQQAGIVELPAVEWVWWDMGARRRRISRLEGLAIQVQAAVQRRDPFALEAPDGPAPPPIKELTPSGAASLGGLLLAAAGVSVLAWQRRVQLCAALYRLRPHGGAKSWRRLRRACRGSDAVAADAALNEVLLALKPEMRRAWLADPALARAIEELQRHRFGSEPAAEPRAASWRGQDLWSALLRQRAMAPEDSSQDSLPELHP